MSVNDVTTRLSQLSATKRALLEKRLQRRTAEISEAQMIRRRERRGPSPLSFAQQRLWFIDQLEPQSSIYNIPVALRLVGQFKVDALRRCLNELVRRHESLRTTFTVGPDLQPVQTVAPRLELILRVEDLSGIPRAEREAEAMRLASEEAQRPFDLSRGPLLRVRLFRLSDEDHMLLFTMHHIISDGWSMGVLVHEIGMIYSAYAAGQESPLAELAIQYADFAAWQREWLQGQVLDEQLSYWRRQLGGELPVLALPTDHPRPPVQGHRGQDAPFKLSKEASDGLKRLSQREGVTLFMTLIAAYKLLLYRHTGQEDILIGTPIANRNRVETEPLIGFFVNTLVLRTNLTGNPSFSELLRRVRKTALEAYAHQDLPFEKLVEELQPERDMSRNALFQVLLALQNAPMGELKLEGLTIRTQEFERGTARLDLEFHLYDLPNGIEGVLVYNADIFERETVRRILERFATLLEAVAASPERRLSDLPVIPPEERRQLLDEWAIGRELPPAAPTIHALFEAQAARTPEATALVCGDEAISYGELDARAESLARRLRVLGVGPEARVGLLLRRSVEQLVGLLGVLKAGGAYVPLDPSTPTERIGYVLRDAGAVLLVTQGELAGALAGAAAMPVLLLDAVDGGASEHEGRVEWAGRVESEADEQNAAYVIYTSGSTGSPKGVSVSHRSLVNAIQAQLVQAEVPVTGTLLQMSYAFDGSLLSIFCTLVQGGTLVVPPEGQQADTTEAARLIHQWRLSHLFTVPSFYSLLLEQAQPVELSSLRVVTVGAETCPPGLVGAHYRRLPEARLFNEYGPTETTIYCAAHECRPEDAAHMRVPIGRPASGARLYVLDHFMQPAPIGVIGELYIGGRGVARGYMGQPGLTAEGFVPDAFGVRERLYRTGDMARWLGCGELELWGRSDEQVKVRGYRVEPGEVETALCGHGGVREAVVLADEDGAGGKRLVAYVVANAEQPQQRPSAGELREYLSGLMPEYMIPGAYVFLESLPLTATGKVDRRALPAPEAGRDAPAESYVAPQTPTEELLARLWGELLKLERVGINDNFFELGGHSLLATQLISRVRESCAVDLPLGSIFKSPTVAGLALHVEAAKLDGAALSSRPLAPVARKGHLPLSFGQQRLWFIHQLEPSSAAYNMPVAVRLNGRLDQAALERTLSEIVSRHESLRTSFRVRDGEPVQLIGPPEEVKLHVTDLGHMPEGERLSEALRLATAEAGQSFDLERGPLYRARLLKLSDEDHVLLFTMHHIISDGWSMGVLVQEVGVLYSAFVEGKESPLAPLPIQYADFAHWQRQSLTGEVLDAHWQYWKRQLGGEIQSLELPADRPRPLVQSFRGASRALSFPSTLVEELNDLARREDVTLFMLLLAAFKVLLHRYTDQEDIPVGTPIANRNRVELEGLIGFFVNTLVLRTDVSGQPSFRELLKRVRTVALEAYAHQDMPFEQLVEQLQPERSMNRSPLFQVMFLLQNTPGDEAVPLPGLTLQPIEVERVTTQFDLSFDLMETPGGMMAVAEYSTTLFDDATIERMLRHYQNVLEGIVADADARITELPLLTNTEREQLLIEWNPREQDYTPDKTLHELFEAQAALTPHAVAVLGNDEQLTYAELNTRANQLAHYLRSLGVRAETRVGVLMERTPEMLAGLLAVIKAGGAYVPLDPRYPKQRLAFMLEDAQASTILTQERFRKELSEHGAQQVVYLDSDLARIAQQDTHHPAAVLRAENLAYVIYTSGSTGWPKGVGVTHRSLISHQAAIRDAYGLRAGDRVLQFAALSFDVAAEEIFPTLLGGATVVLRDERVPDLGAGLLRHIEEHGVTVLNLPSSAWHEWAGELSRTTRRLPDCLRLVVVGSEPLTRKSFERWQRLETGAARLFNAYGTTEATITATLYRAAEANGEEAHLRPALPIGRPVAGTHAYILDSLLQPVAVGCAGHLHLGGAGLARGYLNRPDLTAEKFIPHPYGDEPGARLYRTGDLARYLPDGNIEFLGRSDHQVKLRGFRIEPGEIEAFLNQHAAIRRAVVLARQGADEDKRLVAYVQAEGDQEVTKHELREYLRARVPDFMIPPAIVFVDEFPQTPTGKIDARALPAPGTVRDDAQELVLPRSEVERAIAAIWQEVLGQEKVGVNDNFFDLGGHSLLMVQVHSKLREMLGADLTMLDLFKYPTISSLAKFIAPDDVAPQRFEVELRPHLVQQESAEVAVIGMAGRFPGAKSIEGFWQNLRDGVESISFFSDEELLATGVDPAALDHPNYVKAGSFIEDIDQFDALFFGYNPREAEAMDPQHRLFLECAWEALERAGYDAEKYESPVGVFAGAGPNAYLHNLYSHPEIIEAVGDLQIAIGNEKDHLPTHVSYKLNLRGPSVAVQAACSTSLVAVHMACKSLLNGECKMALAGGVTINLQKTGYFYQEGGIGSPDGHCRAFDQRAQGTIGGSGVGIVLLKRLEEALADGDTIHAVIKGSAVNNDGAAKVGYAAPSVEGQREVIRVAQAAAGINPETISYVEAHGTGTKLGDPIEVAALTEVFRAATAKKGFCAIGSLKTNMGHLDAAAGVGGLIKTVLALEHELIPPSLHFEQPNPALDLDNSPFYVNKDLTEWKSEDGPRRAGVSSFGIGGTNAHVILEEAPPVEPSSPSREWQLLMLSAKTETALDQATANLAAHLRQHPGVNLADVAYTLQAGRKTFNHRRVVVCRDVEDALASLDTLDPQRVFTSEEDALERRVVFMFPGQGAQYVNMGLGLYRHEPLFREQVDRCSEMLKPDLGFNLRDVLYPDEEHRGEAASLLQQTHVTQPASFVVAYALARVWMAWGLKPSAMIGHSIGEYVAACLAGVFSLADALSLVAFRGQLFQSLPEGAMLSVPLAEDEIRGMLGEELSLAATNGPALSVVSGSSEAMEEFQKRLAEKGITCRRLLTSHAFHSRMVEAIIAPFTARVKKMNPRAPQIPYISNVSGAWIKTDEATDPAYWGRHLRQTVRFAEGARQLLRDASSSLIEVGPGQTLSTLVRPLARQTGQFVINSLRHPDDACVDEQFLMRSLGRLWLSGVRIDWAGFYARERRRRLTLPTYPFERRRYWVGWERQEAVVQERRDLQLKKQDVADWFYLPYWKPSVLAAVAGGASESLEGAPTRLIFSDDAGFGARLAQRLRQSGGEVMIVKGGERFDASDGQDYTINIARPEDYEALVLDLKSRGKMPGAILHTLGITRPESAREGGELSERVLNESFYSLTFLAQALGRQNVSDKISITVLTNGMQHVSADDRLLPERATTLGPCKVIPQEYPNLACRSIDVILDGAGDRQEEKLLAQVVSEVAAESPETVIAYRGNRRWVQAFEPVRLERSTAQPARLKEEGVYLITGGLGGIGLVLAQHLAQALRARLILVGRSGFPTKDEWPQWLKTHAEADESSEKIRKILAMENVGAQVLAFGADVCDRDRMREVVGEARARFGKIDGVIHAAGISPGGMIEAKTPGLAASVLAPKVQGARVLEELFKDEPLDFLMLFSSLNSVTGAFGQVDYCAANAFLDAFAHYNVGRSGTPTVTVNWDTWADVGMAVRAHSASRLKNAATLAGEDVSAGFSDREQSQSLFADAISSAEGADAFTRILSNDVPPQVIVSTRDLQSVISQSKAITQSRILEEMAQLGDERTAHPRPSLQVAYVAPRNELEEQIAGIWQSVLGIEQVGVNDDFFELGGHSLLATQLISRLRGLSEAEIPLRVIFEQPTVGGLAGYIEQATGGRDKPPAIVPVARQARQVNRTRKL